MSVQLTAISVAVLAISGTNPLYCAYGLMGLPIALGFIVYAGWTYLWRTELIKEDVVGRLDDYMGPIIIGTMLVFALAVQLAIKIYEFFPNPNSPGTDDTTQ